MLSRRKREGAMTAYGVDGRGTDLTVFKFPDKKTAQSLGNSLLLVENEQELAESSVSTTFLAALWNKHNPAEQVKRWADRNQGAKKIFGMFDKIAIEPKTITGDQENEVQTQTAEKTKGVKAPAKAKGGKAVKAKAETKANGNSAVSARSKMAGLKLYPAGKSKKENPRKAGSHGWRSMKIIMDNPGITYEDFIKKGGRSNDLAYDIGKGFAEARGK